jgi:hypothetical protein
LGARQRIVRVDGVFEAALGIVLLARAAIDGGDFPAIDAWLVALFGVALLPVAWVLLLLARRPVAPRTLRLLAAANIATAAAALVWRAAADGFSTAGSTLVLVTAACLAGLGAVQLAASRERG